jgi:hypothetical protein
MDLPTTRYIRKYVTEHSGRDKALEFYSADARSSAIHNCLQSLLSNAGIVPPLGSDPFFPNHHWSVIRSYMV